MFCSKCGSLLMPKDGKMVCNCGHSEKDGKLKDAKKKKSDVFVVEKKIETLPVTDYDCGSCKNTKAYFWLLQTRSADEPETRFYKCTKCGAVHREY